MTVELANRPFAEEHDRSAPSLIHLLHRAGQRADEIFSSSIEDFALTPRQFAVLNAAAGLKKPSQAALVAATGIDRSTLADIVGRLVEKGLIERSKTEHDARAYAITVTGDGLRTLYQLKPRIEEMERRLLASLPQQRRDDLIEDLEQIVASLGPSGAKVHGK